jgi:hypothetical protein
MSKPSGWGAILYRHFRGREALANSGMVSEAVCFFMTGITLFTSIFGTNRGSMGSGMWVLIRFLPVTALFDESPVR